MRQYSSAWPLQRIDLRIATSILPCGPGMEWLHNESKPADRKQPWSLNMSETALKLLPNELSQQVVSALGRWIEPVHGCDLISAGAVAKLEAFTFRVYLDVHLRFPAEHYGPRLAAELKRLLLASTQAKVVEVTVTWSMDHRLDTVSLH